MKKLLSLVLSFALVCTLISGCGPKGGGGNSSNQPLDAAETTFGLTPLPELCRQAGKETRGTLREVFFNLARELEWQTSPDAASCMTAALKRSHELPRRIRGIMKQLGHTLGRFDLPGQKQGLEEVKEACRMELESLGKNRETRLRSYGTLGLCAGAALAILFL